MAGWMVRSLVFLESHSATPGQLAEKESSLAGEKKRNALRK
jgi:hypothetical protein